MTTQTAIFGSGCFWCTEAVFKMIKGVVSVVPGYAGGAVPNPTYEHVCNGNTGHAEVIRVEYDPAQISFEELLTVFFGSHDPTTLNRQGNDVGTQYRSVIFYTNKEQKETAEKYIQELQFPPEADPPLAEKKDGLNVVTTVEPLTTFYEAENYHHEYFAKNPDQAYCAAVISPKLKKVREKLAALLK